MKSAFDVAAAALLLTLLSVFVLLIGVAIKLDSRGPVFYRARRVGRNGSDLDVLKFRKMHAMAAGIGVTVRSDARFTRIGRFLAASKLDEIPQLWNVVKGEMSLVGPRPEDRQFVELHADAYTEAILTVRPGITGLSQLAFADESRILDPKDTLRDYHERLLPQKVRLDCLYVRRRTLWMDLRILAWTFVPVLLRSDVAVHRPTGELGRRRRPSVEPHSPIALLATQTEGAHDVIDG